MTARLHPGFQLAASVSLLSGCAPVIDVEGAYFPVWVLCGAIGIVAALAMRWLFARVDLESHLGPLPLVYSCLAILVGCVTWLLVFRA